jgi:hypothetical protein
MNPATKLVLALMAIGAAGIAMVAIGLGSSPKLALTVTGLLFFVAAYKLISVSARW